MQSNSWVKSVWRTITALTGAILLVSVGFGQTVRVDAKAASDVHTAINTNGSTSTIRINTLTGNAFVNTSDSVNSCSSGTPGGRSVTVTSPSQAAQNSTIQVSWTANNFVGATTCNLSLGAGSTVPSSGWTGTGLSYPSVASRTVVLGPSQPATYLFLVQCFDATNGPTGSATTIVQSGAGDTCLDPNIGQWRGQPLSVSSQRIWETTFTSGTPSTPFPGAPNFQITETLGLDAYNSMRFTVPLNAPVRARYDLVNFVSTASPEGVLAGSVSPCEGDFRESELIDVKLRKFCISMGGIGGIAIGVVVDAGAGPHNGETCEIVRGRNYYFNTTFGTNISGGDGAYCTAAGAGCIYKFEYRLARRATGDE